MKILSSLDYQLLIEKLNTAEIRIKHLEDLNFKIAAKIASFNDYFDRYCAFKISGTGFELSESELMELAKLIDERMIDAGELTKKRLFEVYKSAVDRSSIKGVPGTVADIKKELDRLNAGKKC